MNAKEALKIANDLLPETLEEGYTWHNANRLSFNAEGFLECNEKYKPLVEALKFVLSELKANDIDIPGYETIEDALDHYRKEILGESKPLGE